MCSVFLSQRGVDFLQPRNLQVSLPKNTQPCNHRTPVWVKSFVSLVTVPSDCFLPYMFFVFVCNYMRDILFLQLEWGEGRGWSGVTPSQGSEDSRTPASGSPQRLNASRVLLVERWEIEELWTNRERSTQSRYFFVQTISKKDCLLFHQDIIKINWLWCVTAMELQYSLCK